MPDIRTLLEAVPNIPELRALASCAARARLRFALRGGVLRNLYVNFYSWQEREPSLYEFVDAFSDIDLIVVSERDWQQLRNMLSASLPFAGFHHWEARTFEWVERVQADFEMIPVDRFVLWIDGTSEGRSQFHWDATGIDVHEAMELYEQRRYSQMFPELWLRREDRAAMLLAVLKMARYALQYEADIAPIDRNWLGEQLDRVLHVWLARRLDRLPESATPHFSRRIELAVADVLFNALNWGEALNLVRHLHPVLRYAEGHSEFLRGVLTGEDAVRARYVGATYYRQAVRGNPQLSLRFATEAAARGPGSVIPWTPVTVSGPQPEEDCCPYIDFRYGPAAIIWRDPRVPGTFGNITRASDYGAVARVNLFTQYGEPQSTDKDVVVPLPGIVRPGTALSLRLDHGYIQSIARRNITFDAGLIPQDWATEEQAE